MRAKVLLPTATLPAMPMTLGRRRRQAAEKRVPSLCLSAARPVSSPYLDFDARPGEAGERRRR